MRTLAIAALLLFAGCEHYVDLNDGDFLRGKASPQQFSRDNATCQDKATVTQSMAGGNGDPHGIYNSAYRGCMQGLGYHPVSPVGFGSW